MKIFFLTLVIYVVTMLKRDVSYDVLRIKWLCAVYDIYSTRLYNIICFKDISLIMEKKTWIVLMDRRSSTDIRKRIWRMSHHYRHQPFMLIDSLFFFLLCLFSCFIHLSHYPSRDHFLIYECYIINCTFIEIKLLSVYICPYRILTIIHSNKIIFDGIDNYKHASLKKDMNNMDLYAVRLYLLF